MAKQEPATATPTPTPTPTTTAATACGNCGVQERRLLHHLRHRGIFRRLCTSCVLKLNPHTFCPTCFLVYDRTPSTTDTVTCLKCYSYTHPNCLVVGSVGPAKSYTCPLCINPNAPVFALKRAAKNEGESDESFREIDRKAARVLLAAARIAEVSMSRAAEGARMEAERRAKEAALTRKRAREALEHVAFLVAKENLKRKEIVSAEVSGSGNVGAVEKNYKVGGGRGGGNGVGVAVQNRIGNQIGDAVDLREKERLQGLRAQNAVSGPPNNGVPMGMDESDRQRVSPGSIDHGAVKKNEGSADLGRFEGNNGEGVRVINGPFSVLPGGDMQTSHGREENVGS